MDEENEKQAAFLQGQLETKTGTKRGLSVDHASHKGKKRKGADGEAVAIDEAFEEASSFQQPALITGAKLKPYQLEGLQWMVSLDQNGISGILGIFNSFIKSILVLSLPSG